MRRRTDEGYIGGRRPRFHDVVQFALPESGRVFDSSILKYLFVEVVLTIFYLKKETAGMSRICGKREDTFLFP